MRDRRGDRSTGPARWYDVSVQGMEAHAGPTPMELRRDALLATSTADLEVNRIAVERRPHARSTV